MGFDKKAISEVVAVSLLLVVSVLLVISFQNFSNSFLSDINSNVEGQSFEDDFKIYGVIGDKLYFQNDDSDFKINFIRVLDGVGDDVCDYTYNDLIVDNSTIGYWSFDVMNGTSLVDLSLNNNDGIIFGGLEKNEFEETSKGKFLMFDGRDDYVRIPYSSVLDTDKSFTFSIWVKLKYTFYDTYIKLNEFLSYSGQVINEGGNDVLYLNSSMGEGYVAEIPLGNLEGGYSFYDSSKIGFKPDDNLDVFRMELWDVTNNIELTNVTCGSENFDNNDSYLSYEKHCLVRIGAYKENDYVLKYYYFGKVNVSLRYVVTDVFHRSPIALWEPYHIFSTYALYSGSGGTYSYNSSDKGSWAAYDLLYSQRYEPLFLTFSYDENAKEVRTYVNGEFKEVSDNFDFKVNFNSDLTIGMKELNNPGSFFIGSIGEVKMWDKVLSDEEIESEYLNKGESVSFYDINKCGLIGGKSYNVLVYTDDGIFEKEVYYG